MIGCLLKCDQRFPCVTAVCEPSRRTVEILLLAMVTERGRDRGQAIAVDKAVPQLLLGCGQAPARGSWAVSAILGCPDLTVCRPHPHPGQ